MVYILTYLHDFICCVFLWIDRNSVSASFILGLLDHNFYIIMSCIFYIVTLDSDMCHRIKERKKINTCRYTKPYTHTHTHTHTQTHTHTHTHIQTHTHRTQSLSTWSRTLYVIFYFSGSRWKADGNNTIKWSWATSWYTLAATRVLRRWIEECPHKEVALNDGTCT